MRLCRVTQCDAPCGPMDRKLNLVPQIDDRLVAVVVLVS
jgi:hypothetical protein